MSNQNVPNTAYSLGLGPLSKIFPPPVISIRAPGANDIGYQIGQIWIVKATNSSYILTNVLAGVATWTLFAGAGAAIFPALTVNGPTILNGALTVNAAGNAVNISTDAVANVTTIGNVTGASQVVVNAGTAGFLVNTSPTGIITLGAATMTGTITIGQSTAAAGQIINIGTAAAPNAITINSLTGAASTLIRSGTGGIVLQATNGNLAAIPVTSTTASPTATVVMNNRLGVATFTGFTTAAAGVQDFTITNNQVLTTSGVFVQVTNLNASGNNAIIGTRGVTQAAGSLIVHAINNGALALGAGDSVLISFWVIS